MAMNPCRECGGTVSSSATNCPHCGHPSPAGLSPLVKWGGAFIGLALVGATAFSATRREPAAQPTVAAEPAYAATGAQAPAPAAPPVTKPSDVVMAQRGFADAYGAARNYVLWGSGDISPGAAMLVVWLAAKGSWHDVDPGQDETTVARIKKDPESAAGKRLCVRGSIIEIHRDKGTPTFWGNLMTGSLQTVTFLAAKSTGELVENRQARFCGMSAGTWSYSNQGGGETTSTVVVGMFDLPENRAR